MKARPLLIPPLQSAARRALGLALALLALAWGARTAAAAPPDSLAPPQPLEIVAHPFARAPALDGVLAEWSGVGADSEARMGRPEQIHPGRRGGWKGPADASALVRVGTYGETLYLGITITDDRVFHDPQRAWWHGDSIELFVNGDLEAQGTPPHEFSDGCWQIFLMPANRELPWGVVYRGKRMHFGAGGLRGIRVHKGPERDGGYDVEVAIPLRGFGVRGTAPTRLGFALAMNDSDAGPEDPGTYLSWNAGFDLYRHPDHFGVLRLPARAPAAPGYAEASDEDSPWWPLLAILAALAALVVLAGPGARALARFAPRPKWIGLGLTALLAGGVHWHAEIATSDAREETTARLEALAAEARAIYVDYLAFTGPAAITDPEARASGFRALLAGKRTPCRPGVVEARLVPLQPGGAYASGPVPDYAIDLRTARQFVLTGPVTTRRVRLRLGSVFRGQDRASTEALGTLTFRAGSGAVQTVPVVDEPGRADAAPLSVDLGQEAAWTRVEWTPDRGAPPLVLRGLDAVDAGGMARPLLLSGSTAGDVPVLAHPGGPDEGRTLPPQASATFPLPVLAGADRMWLLLSPERAFPHLLGDHVLGRVEIDYEDGRDAKVVELRNGEHLTSDRLLPGIRRPADVRSHEAFRWRDSMGTTHLRQALPIPLEPRRLARTLTVSNAGAGGALRVVAATVVRTARELEGARVRVVTDAQGHDGLLLAADQPDFRPYLGPPPDGADGGEVVTVEPTMGDGLLSAPFALYERLAPELAAQRKRADVVLLVCLAIAMFLAVLLVVDAAGRTRQLAHRLAIGVLAAALVPLGVTIFLVERGNTRRVEDDHAARARGGVQHVLGRIDETRTRLQDAADQLARHLAAERDAGQTAAVARLASLYGSSALPAGLAGTVSIVGARVPRMQVPLGSDGAGLYSGRFLEGVRDEPGLHASPWDGLLVVGSARRGGADDWVSVTVGVRLDDGFLTSELRSALEKTSATIVALDADGRPLGAAGVAATDLRDALAGRLDALRAGRVRGGTALLKHATGPRAEYLVAATNLPTAGGVGWLAVGLPRAAIDRALRGQREPLLWLGLFGLVLVVGVAALVARRVADPVRALVRVTDSMRQGTFDVEVPPSGTDEVGRLAVAFDQMRRDLKHRVEDLDFLRGAQDAIATSLEFGRRADTVLQLFAGRFEPDEALLLDARGPGGPVAVIAEARETRRFAERAFPVAAGGWLADALRAKRPVEVSRQVLRPAGATEGLLEERLLASGAAWIATPLRTGKELQGLLLMGWNEVASLPSPESHRLLRPLAGIAGAALNNARLYRLAALDDVTQLPGATAFESALRGDVERALAGGPQAVLLRIGLDHLEHVTLRRGVELSRELQRACAHALVSIVGERVRLGRLREEELAARLPGSPPEEVRRIAEAVRARLRSVEVRPEEGGETVLTTVSIGVARCPGDARSLEFLLDAAGRALAAAQREGGDRVEDAARLDAGAVDMPPFEEGAVFRNEKMVRVVESARRVARTDSSVLITGETGTGKEVIASLVHRRSARANRPFVTVNCAAFPDTLLESELFGHERGAFTGAERRREGRFELADGGTLFLDEVAEMTPSAQVKLLRVLQERQFTRLGGTRTITVDVRIVAATNRDLERAVAEGSFREDLYYRLNVIRLEIPPLRERREEIPPLVDLFLREATRRAGGGPKGLTPAAMDILYRHPWPGNVREIKNVIERCAVLCETEQVGPEHLQLDASHADAGPYLAPRGAPQDDLNPRQRKLLDYLARHGRCTNREYYEMAGTSPRTGLRDLQDLMTRGLLIREGKRRGAVYRLP